jgi:hypothetical protein
VRGSKYVVGGGGDRRGRQADVKAQETKGQEEKEGKGQKVKTDLTR